MGGRGLFSEFLFSSPSYQCSPKSLVNSELLKLSNGGRGGGMIRFFPVATLFLVLLL